MTSFLLASSPLGELRKVKSRNTKQAQISAPFSIVLFYVCQCYSQVMLVMDPTGFTGQESSFNKTCAHVQQAADLKEIQRIPKTCHQNNELCCIAWDTGLAFSLQNVSTGSSKHPVRLMQSFHSALQVTTQVRCQCWALYWLVKYELSKYFVKIVFYKKNVKIPVEIRIWKFNKT